MATSPLPPWGPKRGRNCYVTPAFLGLPNAKLGEKIRSGYPTLAFSGAQKRAELLRNPYMLQGPSNAKLGEKIRSAYLTPAFLGAQKTAELLCNRYILRGLQRQARGENQKWLSHHYLLGGPKVGRTAT